MLAERLLGGDVVGRAEHAAVGRQAVLLERARDPEVGHLGGSLVVDQHVLGLDVAVHDVVGVRAAQGARDLDAVGHGLRDLQPPEPADPLLQRLAVDVLEDDVGTALVLARVDHVHDVRVR